jgi:hypothetical protein
MGKHSNPNQAVELAASFDAQFEASKAAYVEPTLQQKVDAYNAVRQENANLRAKQDGQR